VILGGLLVLLAIGFSESVVALFAVIPPAILGTILFFTGVQLARGQVDQTRSGHDFTVLLVTAGLSMWNVAVGFGVGLLLQWTLLRPGRP
jgi:MFS superfamily sulfate permease-like transporter